MSSELGIQDSGAEGAVAAETHPTRVGLVVTLGAISAAIPLAIDMYLPAMPHIAVALRAPIGAVQMTLPVFLVGLAGGQLIWGAMSDRLGRLGPLLTGCLLFSAAGVVCALCRSVSALLIARFLMGLAGSAAPVITRAIVRDLFDESGAARMLSMMMIVSGIAPILAPSAGGLVLKYGDWPMVFWILAGFGLLSIVLVQAYVSETLPRSRRIGGHALEAFGQYGRLLVDGRFIGYAAAMGFASGALFAYLAGSPFVFITHFGLSPQQYSLITAANGVAIYIVGQTNRFLLRRFHARGILLAGSAIHAAAGLAILAAAASGGGIQVLWPLLMLCVASLGLQFPNATAVAMVPFGEQAGTASALLGMLGFIVGAGSGALVGLLHNGTTVPMAGMVALCSVCAFLSVAASRRGQDRGNRECRAESRPH